jgi:hypothetical protein
LCFSFADVGTNTNTSGAILLHCSMNLRDSGAALGFLHYL